MTSCLTLKAVVMKPYALPVVNLPSTEELLIFLLHEELRNRKFFAGLRALGLEGDDLESNLGVLIVRCAGLDAESDAVLDHYYQLLDACVHGERDAEWMVEELRKFGAE